MAHLHGAASRLSTRPHVPLARRSRVACPLARFPVALAALVERRGQEAPLCSEFGLATTAGTAAPAWRGPIANIGSLLHPIPRLQGPYQQGGSQGQLWGRAATGAPERLHSGMRDAF